jgi:hypothetical protein
MWRIRMQELDAGEGPEALHLDMKRQNTTTSALLTRRALAPVL